MSATETPSQPVPVTFSHAGKTYTAQLPKAATVQDLADHAFEVLHIPIENQKWIISPKPGMIKPPFTDPAIPSVADIVTNAKKIMLLGSTIAQIQSLNKTIQTGAAQASRKIGQGPVKAAQPARTRDWKTLQDEIRYTFHEIRPLDHLPFPDRSTQYLERLRNDPGVKAAMIKHKWSVPLLTELDPAENTSHESRTLGLNKNRGETILLRLRTDAYDGCRDYKTVRTCLCHELAHNVHGEHNRDFYNLMKQIEDEVDKNDWKHGGHALSTQEFYESGESPAQVEHEWTGGTRRLGSNDSSPVLPPFSSSTTTASQQAQARREAAAKAAEERVKKSKDSSH